MRLIRVYQCLCDPTRLRILHLLLGGPLCVCHLQAGLGEPQVKISKHLFYLKKHGMVQMRKVGNWHVYRLPARQTEELKANLRCLQECAAKDRQFRSDMAKLKKLRQCGSARQPMCAPATEKTRLVA
ncbi:MAG TPA: metalloregulator ArsR/SmtB family transcription factor [Opitutales bacterium]|jgi:ArsR family transcriptional regulator|nr:metalloregulator ArsR/SmtB family transcription factor [Opitutales bacterium]